MTLQQRASSEFCKRRWRSSRWRAFMHRALIGDRNPSKRPEVRRKIAESKLGVKRGRIHSAAWRLKMSRRFRGSFNPSKRPQVRRKISLSKRGVPISAATRTAWRLRLLSNPWTYGRTAPFVDRRGRRWHFRSSWEGIFARRLDELRLTWEYEPKALVLRSGRIYIPDFWVSELHCYVEVKGRSTSNKVRAARYAGFKVRLVKPSRGLKLSAWVPR